MTPKFNNFVSNIILEDRELKHPLSKYYKLELLDNGLYKRTYHHGGRVCYTLDKEGTTLHNPDGPAYVSDNITGYFFNGSRLSKQEWEIARKVGSVEKAKKVIDLTNI